MGYAVTYLWLIFNSKAMLHNLLSQLVRDAAREKALCLESSTIHHRAVNSVSVKA